MNCRAIEPLLLAERDGVLAPNQYAALDQHVADCPACRQMRASISAAMADFQTDAAHVPLPDINNEWQALHARLNGAGTARPEKRRRFAPVIWFGASLATAAAIAFAFLTPQNATPKAETTTEVASAEFVEAGNANASTMVYVDKESGWLVVWATDSAAERSI